MNIPESLIYTKSHEWAKHENNEVVVGITEHAQGELRDVVFVELPKVGASIAQKDGAAVIESVKAAFDIYAPISGTISRVNEEVAKSPQLINEDCYGKGWLFAITPSNTEELSQLLSPGDYANQLKASAH